MTSSNHMYGKLVDRKVVPAKPIEVEQLLADHPSRLVGEFKATSSGVRVSTVFLGINHGFADETSLWFETMVFGGDLDGEQDRYETWEEAEVGHAAMVARVLALKNV
jgi:hypothetical protein